MNGIENHNEPFLRPAYELHLQEGTFCNAIPSMGDSQGGNTRSSTNSKLLRPHQPRVCQDGRKRGSFRKLSPEEVRINFLSRLSAPNQNGCMEWMGARSSDYGVLSVDGRRTLAHRYAYQLWKGLIRQGFLILHSCDNKPCCNPEHLREGTHIDNVKDAVQRGLYATGERSGSKAHPESRPRGSKAPKAKLNDQLVQLSRNIYYKGRVPMPKIAAILGIKAISPVITGKGWKHVPMPEGITPETRRVVHRNNNGRSHRKVTPELFHRIREYREVDKLTFREISELTGISENRVYVLCKTESPFATEKTIVDENVLAALVNEIRQNLIKGYLIKAKANEFLNALYEANSSSDHLASQVTFCNTNAPHPKYYFKFLSNN
jgi:HNH endonuclease